MGISTISKHWQGGVAASQPPVSIPNGDKHDFKTGRSAAGHATSRGFQSPMGISTISKRSAGGISGAKLRFQSPMGISTISKPFFMKIIPGRSCTFQSPMGISTISKRWPVPPQRHAVSVSIPNGDKHDFKTLLVVMSCHPLLCFNPQWG